LTFINQEIAAPCLVGDIGGTNARFALTAGQNQALGHALTFSTSAFADLQSAISAYLQQTGVSGVRRACVAIANPIDGDWLRMTNNDWAFSIEATRTGLGLDELRMLNDWEAMALAAPTLGAHELEAIGGGTAIKDAPRGLLGAGTGLGVSSLVRARSGEWVPIAGEGGHVSMSPGNAREAAILKILWRSWSHVSVERVVSGMGLENLYRAICVLNGEPCQVETAADITRMALAGQNDACEEALDALCRLLGNVAGNLALTLGARGGIYMGGGVIGHLGDYFVRSGFRAAFEDKGRFAPYLKNIPTWVIRADQPALRGAAMALGVEVSG
jgi:glucokinase